MCAKACPNVTVKFYPYPFLSTKEIYVEKKGEGKGVGVDLLRVEM